MQVPANGRRWLFSGLALVGGGIAAIAILEAVVRVGGFDRTELQITFDPGTDAWARFDAAKGWVNLDGRHENNRQGFRFPRDFTRESGAERRVALLGDSQVWGVGVEAGEHVGVLLDRRLPGIEVYPFGVAGYGPVQELLVLRQMFPRYGFDEVFAVAFVYNDLVDESVKIAYGGLQKPYFEQTQEGWVVRNVPVPRPILSGGATRLPFFGREPEMDFLVTSEALVERSGLYRAVVGRASQSPALARALATLGLVDVVRERATANERYSIQRIDGRSVPCWHLEWCPEEHWLDGLPAVSAAYVEMNRLCRERGAGFAVVLTPSYMELARDRFDVIDALARSLREENVPVVDLRQVFRSAEDWRNVLGDDRHWTAFGHRLVADALEARLGRP